MYPMLLVNLVYRLDGWDQLKCHLDPKRLTEILAAFLQHATTLNDYLEIVTQDKRNRCAFLE